MRKIILLSALLLSAMNMMGQAYEFETEVDEHGFIFKMNKYVYTNMGIYAKLSLMEDFDPLIEDTKHGLFLELYDTSNDVPSQIYEKIGEGRRLNILLVLENNDRIEFRGHGIGKTEDNVKHGIQINLNCGDNDYNKLIVSNIAAVGIYGLSDEPMIMLLPSFNSAATLKAMYDKSRSSGTSSSSSNASSGPSASCKLDFVLTLEKGVIICKMDDLIISGTRGKDYEVKAIFENTELDCIPHEFYLRKGTSWDNGRDHWNVRIKGHVDDLDYMMWNNRGRFKVHIEITIGNQIVYESNSKYITFYRDGEKWRFVQHN